MGNYSSSFQEHNYGIEMVATNNIEQGPIPEKKSTLLVTNLITLIFINGR